MSRVLDFMTVALSSLSDPEFYPGPPGLKANFIQNEAINSPLARVRVVVDGTEETADAKLKREREAIVRTKLDEWCAREQKSGKSMSFITDSKEDYVTVCRVSAHISCSDLTLVLKGMLLC